MSNKVTLGGERLGSGNRQQIELKNYERSTHDLSDVVRTTMASGTLVPFMVEVGLPGDSWDIDLECDVKTHPTIGPLFGSYKVQLDVFQIPVRLYQGKLHMNMLNIGLKMSDVKLPLIQMVAENGDMGDNVQINPSSIFKYLGISGLGKNSGASEDLITRYFNAVPYLAYYDIYKQYYSNKVEDIGYIIHNDMNEDTETVLEFDVYNRLTSTRVTLNRDNSNDPQVLQIRDARVYVTNRRLRPEQIFVIINDPETGKRNLTELFDNIEYNERFGYWNCTIPKTWVGSYSNYYFGYYEEYGNILNIPKLVQFPLANIDIMRQDILAHVGSNAPYLIDNGTNAPYGLPLMNGDNGYSKQSTQEGLAIKTYQSDIFNNWVSTEWIDGTNGVNDITKVDTSEGYFNIDTLILSRKVYDMLNRIAISDGTYDAWLNSVYTHERARGVENPVYMGGLIKELAFQEVVSNAMASNEGTEQPLGTLAGKGVLTNKHKGGKINIKCDEPCYIMGIVSLTPRIDYSQGNKWDVNLKTMDDFHKPQLDEIGFQSLLSDQMAWWDTACDEEGNVEFREVGKQPAWINYMTSYNRTYGNFAEKYEQMFMTLNRRYEQLNGLSTGILDMTTYIDPSKFNHIFADTRLDAQNFWVQIKTDKIVRRKMSAKVMPNL